MGQCVSCFNNLKSKIPGMSLPLAVMVLIFDIIWPGFGTFLYLCIANCNNWPYHLGVSLAQFFGTAVFLLGWVWSIWWGVETVKKAK